MLYYGNKNTSLQCNSTEKPYLTGRLSTVELTVSGSSLDLLLLILHTFFYFLTKRSNLMRRSAILSLPLQLMFLALCSRMVTSATFTLVQYLWVIHGANPMYGTREFFLGLLQPCFKEYYGGRCWCPRYFLLALFTLADVPLTSLLFLPNLRIGPIS